MATLRGYVPLTLDNSGSGSGTGQESVPVETRPDTYTLFDGFITELYRGRFSYNTQDEANGLLNAIFIFGGDRLYLEVTGLQKDFQTFARLETSPGGRQLAYLLTGDDLVIGSGFDDILKGYAGNDRIEGGGGRDRLFGDAGNDRLIGGPTHDILNGGSGIDLMQGFAGDDSYRVDDSRDRAVERAGEGNDSVWSSVSFALGANVEKLHLVGTGSTNGTGNSLRNEIHGNNGANVLLGHGGRDDLYGERGDDHLIGGDGNDRLFGGHGADLLVGGAGVDKLAGGTGNDRYVIDHVNDQVSESLDAGIDTVISTVSFLMHVDVENLVLVGEAATSAAGNRFANDIRGNGAANFLRGGEGNDLILGGRGADRLETELGTDRVAGGSGADTFLFRDPDDAGLGRARDAILDFERGDLLHLAAIDADARVEDDQSFAFIGTATYSGSGAELRLTGRVLAGDVNGDGRDDFQIAFANGYALQADDILL